MDKNFNYSAFPESTLVQNIEKKPNLKSVNPN